MHRPTLYLLTVVACALNVGPGTQHRLARADEAERFLREAPEQWKRYASETGLLQGRAEIKMIGADGQVNGQSVTHIKQNAKYKMFISQRAGAQASERASRGTVRAFNRQYAFELWRPAADQPWLISRVERSAGGPGFNALADDAAEGTSRLVEGRISSLTGYSLERLTSHPAFRILEASSTNEGYLVARFECRHPMEEKPFLAVQAGKLVVDPPHYYCLRSADFECLWGSGPGQTRVALEYFASPKGLPIPLSVKEEIKYRGPSGESVGGRQVRYELHEVEQLPSDEEFTLTAFGFPEPETPNVRTNGLLWAVVIGLVCVVAGCALKLLFRKRRLGHSAS